MQMLEQDAPGPRAQEDAGAVGDVELRAQRPQHARGAEVAGGHGRGHDERPVRLGGRDGRGGGRERQRLDHPPGARSADTASRHATAGTGRRRSRPRRGRRVPGARRLERAARRAQIEDAERGDRALPRLGAAEVPLGGAVAAVAERRPRRLPP